MLKCGMALACAPVSWYVEKRKEETKREDDGDHRDDVTIVDISHSASVRENDMSHSRAATQCQIEAQDDQNPHEVPRLSLTTMGIARSYRNRPKQDSQRSKYSSRRCTDATNDCLHLTYQGADLMPSK